MISKRYRNIIWVIPALTIILLFTVLPLLMTFKNSLFIGGDITLINFKKLFNDQTFIKSITNSLILMSTTFFTIALGTILSMMLSKILIKSIRKTFISMIFIQYLFLGAAIYTGYTYILNSDYGLLNMILNAFGVDNVNFINDSHNSIITLSVIAIIHPLPFFITTSTFRNLQFLKEKEAIIKSESITTDSWLLTKSLLIHNVEFILLMTYFYMCNSFLSFPLELFNNDLSSMFAYDAETIVSYINRAINFNNPELAAAASLVSLIVICLITATFAAIYLSIKKAGGKYE